MSLVSPKKRGRPKKENNIPSEKFVAIASIPLPDGIQIDSVEYGDDISSFLPSSLDTRSLQERAFEKAQKFPVAQGFPSIYRIVSAYINSLSDQMREFHQDLFTSTQIRTDVEISSALFRYLMTKKQVYFWVHPDHDIPSHGDIVFCAENGRIEKCYLIDRYLPRENKLFVLENESANIIECKAWNAFGRVME